LLFVIDAVIQQCALIDGARFFKRFDNHISITANQRGLFQGYRIGSGHSAFALRGSIGSHLATMITVGGGAS
jgi:hypothetical protein